MSSPHAQGTHLPVLVADGKNTYEGKDINWKDWP